MSKLSKLKILLVAAFALLGAAATSQATVFVPGMPVINMGYINCQLYNNTTSIAVVSSVVYDYSCREITWPYRTMSYRELVACRANCAIAPGFTQIFTGPAPVNCNLVGMACTAGIDFVPR